MDEPAAVGGSDGRQPHPGDIDRRQPRLDGDHLAAQNRFGADDPRYARIGWTAEDLGHRPRLEHPPLLHDDDSVAERQGLGVVVGDEDDRQPRLDEPAPQGRPQERAERRVERRERLVEEEEPRPTHQGPRQRHTLLLAAGERRRHPPRERFEIEAAEGLGDAHGTLRCGEATERVADVSGDVEPGKEGQLLAEHADIARLRRQVDAPCGVEPRPAVKRDPPCCRSVEAGQRPQDRRLATARRAVENDHAVAGLDGAVDRRAGSMAEGEGGDEPLPRRAHRPDPFSTGRRASRCTVTSATSATATSTEAVRAAEA